MGQHFLWTVARYNHKNQYFNSSFRLKKINLASFTGSVTARMMHTGIFFCDCNFLPKKSFFGDFKKKYFSWEQKEKNGTREELKKK